MLEPNGPIHAEHFVHFYTSDEGLCANAARFLAEGLREGESAVVIMKPEHLSLVRQSLRFEETDPNSPLLRTLDARATLAAFSDDDGFPSWPRFEATIGPVLSERAAVSRTGRVRAYGEMVDLLWQDGKLAAAIRLEGYWNRILAGRDVPLYCAYRADILDKSAVIEPALSVHSHLRDGLAHPLQATLEAAIDNVLGAGRAAALRPLIMASQINGAKLPPAEAAVFWLRRNLNEADVTKILEITRVRLHQAAAA